MQLVLAGFAGQVLVRQLAYPKLAVGMQQLAVVPRDLEM
jgi:hypothetical protein